MKVLKFYLSPRKIYCISHNQYLNTAHSNLFFFLGFGGGGGGGGGPCLKSKAFTLFEVKSLQLAQICWHENEQTNRLIRQFDIGSGVLQ